MASRRFEVNGEYARISLLGHMDDSCSDGHLCALRAGARCLEGPLHGFIEDRLFMQGMAVRGLDGRSGSVHLAIFAESGNARGVNCGNAVMVSNTPDDAERELTDSPEIADVSDMPRETADRDEGDVRDDRGDLNASVDEEAFEPANTDDGWDDGSERHDVTAELPVVPSPVERSAATIGAPETDPEESHTTEVRRAADLTELVGLSKARYTRDELLAKVDMGDTDSTIWWRAMGLVEVPEGTVAFTADDLAILRALRAVLAEGDAREDHVLRLARLLGGSFSRISEAQVSVIEDVLTTLEPEVSLETAADRSAALVSDPASALKDLFEESMLYVWRRHLFASLGRWIGADPDHDSQALGFIDISDFSHMSKRTDPEVLGEVIERFEFEAVDIVSTHGGRVVKFIGDEVFFVIDTLPEAADVALEMVERMRLGDHPVHVHGGLAYGPTLTMSGDVFGNTVNLAKRLTDVARKGRILIPKSDAPLLEDREDLTVRRVGRSFDLKGFGRTSTISVSRTEVAGSPAEVEPTTQ